MPCPSFGASSRGRRKSMCDRTSLFSRRTVGGSTFGSRPRRRARLRWRRPVSASRRGVASRNSASEINDICSATRKTSGPRGRSPMPTSGWRRPSSFSSGWMTRSSRRAPNQSSTLGSSEPAATTNIAQPSRVAAAPTPTGLAVPTARIRKKNADASTISTMPMVNTNRARPRRVRLEYRIPAHDTRDSASSTYSSGNSQGSELCARIQIAPQIFLGRHLRLLSCGEEGRQVTTAMRPATPYCDDRDLADGGRLTPRCDGGDHHAAACRAPDERHL